jgi:hypothetical protein
MKHYLNVAAAVLSMAGVASAGGGERWLHVKVVDSEHGGENVRINLPISLAEKVLPTLSHGDLQQGKIHIGKSDLDGVDMRALMDAVRDTPDNEFISVQGDEQDVRVAKVSGKLVIHVIDKENGGQKVDITAPIALVDALLSSGTKDLDMAAALRVLKNMGDTTLVTVKDGQQQVKIWVDAHNTAD